MARTISEWVAKHDDAAIPGDVKLRIWSRAKGYCQICTRKVLAGEPKHFDHIMPLADGGRHAEKNLQIACVACHATKTAGEATERAKVKAVAKSVLGLKAKPAKPLRGASFPKSDKPRKPVVYRPCTFYREETR